MSAAGAKCPDQASFSIAELAFGLVNCNYKIVAFRADEWLCEAGHTAAILGDLVGNRGQLGGCRFWGPTHPRKRYR
jgi:hypothetical protein